GRAGERQGGSRELVALILREPRAAESEIAAAAAAVGWRPPATVAAMACGEDDLMRVAGRLPADALTAPVESLGCAIIADPEGPGRRRQIQRAVRGRRAAW